MPVLLFAAMAWWLWIVVGFALLAGEVLITNGFDLMFFGFAALAVGAVVGVGALTEIWLQWVLFSVLAVVSLGLFRRRLLSRMKSPAAKDLDSLQGEVVEAADTIAPGAVGQGYLRGTTWTVHNIGAAILTRGQRAVVERVDGVTLRVKPE